MKLLILLLNLVPMHDNLLGNWTLEKIEMADGSKVIERGSTYKYFQINFNDKVNGSYSLKPVERTSKFTYQLSGIRIQLSTGIIYEIEKLNPKVLILLEVGIQDREYQEHEMKRLHFTNTNSKMSEFLSSTKRFNKDGIVIYESNNVVFPQYNGVDLRSDISTFLENSGFHFKDTVNANFVVLKDGALADVTVFSENESVTTKKLLKLRDAILSTSKNWKPATVADSSINTTLKIKCYFETIFSTPIFQLQTEIHNEKPEFPPLSNNNMEKSRQFFFKGATNMQAGNWDKALKAFTDCISIDSLNIDAHYNRAQIYWIINRKDLACRDWEILSKLNQIGASKEFQEKCDK